jgi:hypothetical protein
MAARRGISLYHILFLSPETALDTIQEYTGLVLSICMLVAIILIKPLFTEIKQSEAEAKESRQKFQIFSDYTYDWEYWISPDSRIIHITPSCERFTGYSVEEFYKKPELLVELVHPDDQTDFVNEHMKKILPNQAHYADFRIVTKDGEVRWFAHGCQPVFDDKGKWLGRRGSNRDITIRKRLESELEIERDTLKMYFDLVGAIIVALDREGNVSKINKFGANLLGYPPDDIIGKNWFDNYIPSVDKEAVRSVFNQIMNGETAGVEAYDNSIVTKDGAARIVSWRNTYIKGGNGKIAQTLSSGQDITERIEAEIELKKHRDHLEEMVKQRTAELEAFTYSVSHDLRAPLRSIDGFSQVVIEDYSAELNEKALEYLGKVRAATERMALMIDDLLLLSRVTRGDIATSKVDISAMAEELVQSLGEKDSDRKKNIKIQKGMSIVTDPVLIRIVLENLFGNAWKFTAGCKVVEIDFRCESTDDELIFSIRDNGVGFDPRYAEKLFAPFQRLHTQDEFPGTGIGLATVARVIHRLEGRVWAESEPGKGATFSFSIPRTKRGKKGRLS